ncbi:hypothetical protein [Geodermatophilus sp. URMC 65]
MNEGAKETVVRVARDVVAQLAPQELADFDAAAEAYLAAPSRVRRRLNKDDPLGFGVEEISVLLSPVALAVAQSTLETLAQDAARSSITAMGARLRRFLLRHRRVRRERTPLSPDQLADVRRGAMEKGKQLGLDDQRAALLADAIIGRLVTQNPG